MADLNLASRPARNETLPTLGFYVALAALMGVTVEHGITVRSLMPDRTSARRAEVARLEEDAARIRVQAAALRSPAPDKGVVARWVAIKDLVDKRTFSWTKLLSRLETVIPEGVRITAIVPHVEKGTVQLELTVEAQSYEEGLVLLQRLQQRAAFRGPRPVSASSKDDVSEYRYSMEYDPTAPDEARAADRAGSGGEASEDAEAATDTEPADDEGDSQ
jgi:Tfp pilus assembly protein PilN